MTDCSAVHTLCIRLRKRAADPRLVLVPGLADDLKSIGEAFTALDYRVQLLARAELARQGNYALSKIDYHDLVMIGMPSQEGG